MVAGESCPNWIGFLSIMNRHFRMPKTISTIYRMALKRLFMRSLTGLLLYSAISKVVIMCSLLTNAESPSRYIGKNSIRSVPVCTARLGAAASNDSYLFPILLFLNILISPTFPVYPMVTSVNRFLASTTANILIE